MGVKDYCTSANLNRLLPLNRLTLPLPQSPLHLRDQMLQPLTRGVHQLQLVLDVSLLRLRRKAGEVALAVRRLDPRPDAYRPDGIAGDGARGPQIDRRPRSHRGARGEGRGRRRAELVEVDGLVRGHRVEETQAEERHFVVYTLVRILCGMEKMPKYILCDRDHLKGH